MDGKKEIDKIITAQKRRFEAGKSGLCGIAKKYLKRHDIQINRQGVYLDHAGDDVSRLVHELREHNRTSNTGKTRNDWIREQYEKREKELTLREAEVLWKEEQMSRVKIALADRQEEETW
jgi:hypothetical protein